MAMPSTTDASFHPRLKLSAIDTFMPWPALGLWVWHASPVMKTRGPSSAPDGVDSSNVSDSRCPISYTDHHDTSFTSRVYG